MSRSQWPDSINLPLRDSRYDSMENFWCLLKRGISGTYVSVEPFHLFRYLDEQAYRYNNRKDATDFDRFRTAASPDRRQAPDVEAGRRPTGVLSMGELRRNASDRDEERNAARFWA